MTASTLLRTARHARGVSQRALSQAAHVSQPGIASVESGSHDTTVGRLDLLLTALGQRITVLPTRTRPVWEAAVALRQALDEGNESTAWREVIQLADDLAREDGATRVALAVTRPLLVGDARYDALLAAVTDLRLSQDQLPRPKWLDGSEYRLDEPWDVEEIPALQANARQQTPQAIARHGVFLREAELASV
jgi:transcriptional regulator with XRE-family HTH domain